MSLLLLQAQPTRNEVVTHWAQDKISVFMLGYVFQFLFLVNCAATALHNGQSGDFSFDIGMV